MLDLSLQIVAVAAAAVILLRAEPALSQMTSGTHMAVRFAMWVALVSSVARIGWVFYGGVPDFITVLTLVGFAALIFCERRLRILTGRARRYDEKVIRKWI